MRRLGGVIGGERLVVDGDVFAAAMPHGGDRRSQQEREGKRVAGEIESVERERERERKE